MNTLLRGLLYLCASGIGLFAQQAAVSPAGDIGKTLQAIPAHIAQLQPILEQMRPKEWLAKGAPETYLAQWDSSVSQAKSVAVSSKALAQHPENLPEALQLLFRLQSLDNSLGSLREGLKKYQNPELADLLSGVAAENTVNRDKLQQYAIELAAEKDQQFQVADREAQRCRGTLSRETPSTRRPK